MKKIYEDIKKILESKSSFIILRGIEIVIISLLIFYAGIIVGLHKTSYENSWGENYERNFGMMQKNRPIFDNNNNNFPNAHGAVGKIIKKEFPTIIVQDRDNTEKVILIKNDTQIQKIKEKITQNDLQIDDFIVVIGNPNKQGQIEAKFIRIMPAGMPVPPTFEQAPTLIQ